MASAITLKIGPVTATHSFTDDAKVQDVLMRAYAPPDEMTNQQKLDYVLDRVLEDMLTRSRRIRQRELEAQAGDTVVNEINYK